MDERPVQSASRHASRDYSRLATTAFSRQHTAITALVVGAGALGNEVIKNLALVGVERLWIADRDRVEASNLTRSILFCVPDIDDHIARGTPKAVLASQRVREINPDVRVMPYVGEIADLGYGILRRANVVFSCVDNEMARLELGWACSRLRKTVVDGGLGVGNPSSGQVSVFPEEDGPCYGCRKGTDRRRELLQELQGREDPCGPKALAIEAAGGVATTPLMASIVGAFQVEMGLRVLQEESANATGRAYRITLHPTPSLKSFAFSRSPTCSLHDPLSTALAIRECPDGHSDRWTPADVITQSGSADGYLVFDWPMTAKACCHTCGHEWEPFVRRARFRRQRCPNCQGVDLVETVLSGVRATSPWAQRTLADLGLPRGHVYEIIPDDQPETEHLFVEMTGDLLGAEAGSPC